jgi:hypothetical protein
MRASFRRPKSAEIVPGVAAFAHCGVQLRRLNINPSMQRKQNHDFYAAQKFTDFDIDKEKWGQQTQWHTMDCALNPSVTVPSMWSYKGARERFSRWLTMKKVRERRPGFIPEVELRQTYIDYKRVAYTQDPNQVKLLCKYTTWNEALRIEGETKHAQLVMEHKDAEKHGGKVKSWKDLSITPRAVGTDAPKAPTPSATPTSPKPSTATASKSGEAAAAEEEALDVKTPLLELKISTFEITHLFIGQMTTDDWVHITARVTGKYRTPKTAPLFETLIEFPVFELKMGDGINSSNTAPFRVVCVMDRDGARYGKDGNDAAMLRKALSQKRSWFG